MLKKLSFPLSLVAVAVLAACASRAQPVPTAVVVTPPPQSATVLAAPPASSVAPTAAVTTPALRPGTGRIESIAPAPQWSASSGSTQPSGMRRVTARMDDGTTQILDTDAPSLRVGDRVQITPDGFIRNPAQ